MSHRFRRRYSRTLRARPESVARELRTVLQSEGFAALSDVELTDALAEELNVTAGAYCVLAASDPSLTDGGDTETDELLRCRVAVSEGSDPGTTVVTMVDPIGHLLAEGRGDLSDIGLEVRGRIKRAIVAL